MKTILTVIRKEVLDNFRDRRTLLTAVIMGPLFGPLLFAVMINLSIEKSLSAGERDLDVPVIGAELAPNLMRFFESKGINAIDGPETVESQNWRSTSPHSLRPSSLNASVCWNE